jgi:hypothetical protein
VLRKVLRGHGGEGSCPEHKSMSELLLDPVNLVRDSVWGGVVVVAVILIPTLGLLARTIQGSRTSDLTRDEIRLLRAFNEQAKGDPRAYLSVEFAAYKAEVDKYGVKVKRLKHLGYLKDSTIESGYVGHRPVRITATGIRRAENRR